MKILGIESSCDETAAAVVESNTSGLSLRSNVVASSLALHAEFGGVVPEIAARSHLEHINPVVNKALADSRLSWKKVDAIAVTRGPGLGGSLLVGVLTARTLAILHKKPLYAVNHVEAHPYAVFLEADVELPMLALIVSGGHSQLVLYKNHSDYKVLGRTTDDAVGEAFDKVAKILGLPYPGGPSIEKFATRGNPDAYGFPKAKMANKYDFSFSGLKTAVLRTAQNEIGKDYNFPSHQVAKELIEKQKRDIAASFQQAALETLVDKLAMAQRQYQPKSIVVAGGVAASQALRQMVDQKISAQTFYPKPELCTDNGAMIASLGYFKAKSGQPPSDPYSLEIRANLSM